MTISLAAELDAARNAELDSRVIDEAPEQLGSGAATKRSHAAGGDGSGGSAADPADAALAADITKRSRDRLLLDFKLQSLASTKRARLTRGADASDTAGAMAYLRVACATRAELGRARVGGHGCAVISAANELAALRGLAFNCGRYLALQPRTLAEDCALLERTAPFSNERNALLVTSGEKRICAFYINLAAVAGDVVFLPPSERRKAIGERWGGAGACRGLRALAVALFASRCAAAALQKATEGERAARTRGPPTSTAAALRTAYSCAARTH